MSEVRILFTHLGAFPPVDFLAVCLVRAILNRWMWTATCDVHRFEDIEKVFDWFLQTLSLIVFKDGEDELYSERVVAMLCYISSALHIKPASMFLTSQGLPSAVLLIMLPSSSSSRRGVSSTQICEEEVVLVPLLDIAEQRTSFFTAYSRYKSCKCILYSCYPTPWVKWFSKYISHVEHPQEA